MTVGSVSGPWSVEAGPMHSVVTCAAMEQYLQAVRACCVVSSCPQIGEAVPAGCRLVRRVPTVNFFHSAV